MYKFYYIHIFMQKFFSFSKKYKNKCRRPILIRKSISFAFPLFLFPIYYFHSIPRSFLLKNRSTRKENIPWLEWRKKTRKTFKNILIKYFLFESALHIGPSSRSVHITRIWSIWIWTKFRGIVRLQPACENLSLPVNEQFF